VIGSPDDLRPLSLDGLRQLSEDVRQEILSACMRNGGHLGASLGAVELAIALHRVFDSPDEPIVWDVGHQAYAHKLLTGRWRRFGTLRTTSGISGFLSRDESEHDVFGAGHSSTALSAALAMAWARRGSGRWTVAVVGDGGLTAGLALEALNNARALATGPLLVVLNDNQMSISPNVGAISALLAGGQARELFAQFGFDYAGPIDGHDLGALLGTLEGIRAGYAGRPVVLHALTQKGKGYEPAEERPATYHGIGPVQAKPGQRTYSDAFGEALVDLAASDPRIVAITAAMPEGTGLTEFARRYPDRFFDVGIAEPHAVTFAAGLATQGFRPVVAIYSTFLQRGIDQVIHDVALQRLGVTFAIDRAGLVGADGPTHHGVFDLAYLGMVPGLRCVAAACLDDVRMLLAEATASGSPWSVRYPRGTGAAALEARLDADRLRWHAKAGNPRLVFVGLGAAAWRVEKAAAAVGGASAGVTAISCVDAKPVPHRLIEYLDAHPDADVLTVEEGVVRGGFGAALALGLAPRKGRLRARGIGDRFVPHGAVAELEASEGLSPESLAAEASDLLAR
jgi:1-deoxy-D-xylulose-5-phosphate synthase